MDCKPVRARRLNGNSGGLRCALGLKLEFNTPGPAFTEESLCIVIVRFAIAVMATVGSSGFPTRASSDRPNTAGGMNRSRAAARRDRETLQAPATVDNKPGATAAAGTAFVANPPPDGITCCYDAKSLYSHEKDKLFGYRRRKLSRQTPQLRCSPDPSRFACNRDPIKPFRKSSRQRSEAGWMSFSRRALRHTPGQR